MPINPNVTSFLQGMRQGSTDLGRPLVKGIFESEDRAAVRADRQRRLDKEMKLSQFHSDFTDLFNVYGEAIPQGEMLALVDRHGLEMTEIAEYSAIAPGEREIRRQTLQDQLLETQVAGAAFDFRQKMLESQQDEALSGLKFELDKATTYNNLWEQKYSRPMSLLLEALYGKKKVSGSRRTTGGAAGAAARNKPSMKPIAGTPYFYDSSDPSGTVIQIRDEQGNIIEDFKFPGTGSGGEFDYNKVKAGLDILKLGGVGEDPMDQMIRLLIQEKMGGELPDGASVRITQENLDDLIAILLAEVMGGEEEEADPFKPVGVQPAGTAQALSDQDVDFIYDPVTGTLKKK